MPESVQAKRFNDVLLRAFDKAFLFLGTATKTAVYSRLEKDFFLARHELPNRIEDLEEALQDIFGCACKPLKNLIMNRLSAELWDEYGLIKYCEPKPELRLQKYIETVKPSYVTLKHPRSKNELIARKALEHKNLKSLWL
jgi:hypothetical protein